jgi:hypothetical protein
MQRESLVIRERKQPDDSFPRGRAGKEPDDIGVVGNHRVGIVAVF